MHELVNFVTESLYALSNKKKARKTAAYMKTDMPFYGVQKPERAPIYKKLKDFPLTSRSAYTKAVKALWKLEHREEKYAAIALARMHPAYIDAQSIPLYRRMITEGAWWDFVDDIAVNLVGATYLDDPKVVAPIMDEWVEHDDLWLRRSAIISQNKHKERADHPRLFRYCLARADEKEFFIRKAIGWALREYSYAEPERVKKFLLANQQTLSGLSFREGAKRLVRVGLMAR